MHLVVWVGRHAIEEPAQSRRHRVVTLDDSHESETVDVFMHFLQGKIVYRRHDALDLVDNVVDTGRSLQQLVYNGSSTFNQNGTKNTPYTNSM